MIENEKGKYILCSVKFCKEKILSFLNCISLIRDFLYLIDGIYLIDFINSIKNPLNNEDGIIRTNMYGTKKDDEFPISV